MQLKLDARARRWLRRLPRVNVYSVAELALMAGFATQVARLLWVVATPVTPLGDWRPAGIALPGSPLSILSGFDPFFRLGAPADAPAAVTSLQLTLFGIRLDEATGRGSAIVAGPDGVQQSVAVGEEVQPGVRLKAVAFDHITLDRGGATEDLFLDQSGATPAPPVAGAVPITAAAPGVAPPPVADAVPASRIRQEIGFIPRLDGGRISGLIVRPQGSGIVFQKAGLREGDVVTSIGGRPVSGPGDLDRVTADFAGGGNVPITVERGQQTLSLSISVAGSRP
ncbi:PDZ domain-containing protein [Microvirga sp. SRT01]|uniref:PDZ domain-containing protein n=1 Tax=Sphingomonas longa TaxID=2778730 RepID=A0ABS2DBQ0_9SPHN|nr:MULTISPECIES: type II secretion system protein N [Alphaproteobacteria]MBM6578361.1 PDZ domain-containing protein [Sphingomonas sp. BT552]MBR7711402.1 PDZ domain-containing protein [Microvirga sp. SRT01]